MVCPLLIICPLIHLVSQMICSDGDDGTPLACAAGKGHVKVVNYLLGHDVDINGGITVSYYIANCNIYSFCFALQATPVLVASQNGHEKCVKQLLQRPHIDVTAQDEDGYNCLSLAAINRHLYVNPKFTDQPSCVVMHTNRQTALAIVNSPHWQDALIGCDKHCATPMRLLIKFLPGTVHIIIHKDNCDSSFIVLLRCSRSCAVPVYRSYKE